VRSWGSSGRTARWREGHMARNRAANAVQRVAGVAQRVAGSVVRPQRWRSVLRGGSSGGNSNVQRRQKPAGLVSG